MSIFNIFKSSSFKKNLISLQVKTCYFKRSCWSQFIKIQLRQFPGNCDYVSRGTTNKQCPIWCLTQIFSACGGCLEFGEHGDSVPQRLILWEKVKGSYWGYLLDWLVYCSLRGSAPTQAPREKPVNVTGLMEGTWIGTVCVNPGHSDLGTMV